MVSVLFDVLRAALERAEPLGLRRVEQHPEQGLGVRRDLLGVPVSGLGRRSAALGGPLEGWRVASKRLGALTKVKRGALGRG